MRLLPTTTGSGASVFVMLTSADGVTVVGALAGLFEALGSAVVDETGRCVRDARRRTRAGASRRS